MVLVFLEFTIARNFLYGQFVIRLLHSNIRIFLSNLRKHYLMKQLCYLLFVLLCANNSTPIYATTTSFGDDDIHYKASISVETFTFERNKNNVGQPFTVTQQTKEAIVADKENVTYHNALFFDNESEIGKVKATSYKKRPVYISSATSAYESEGIFHSDAKIHTVSFPLTQDVPTYFEANVEYKDAKYLPSVYFHTFYPIRKKRIIVEVPKWLDVEIKEFNFDKAEVKKQVKEEKNTTIYEFEMTELEARERESNSVGPSYELPHVLILCKSLEEGGKKKRLLASVDDLYGWYHSLVKQVNNDPDALRPTVEKLIAPHSDDQAKIESIYYWVQDNIRYIAFEDGIAGFKPAAAQDVFDKRYGDCKGMSNLLKEMLDIAGYDARLTWLGTRRLAYDYSTPSLSVDNHMICTLMKDGKKIFLDPTETYSPYGEFAHRIQGQQVMIENNDTYELAEIPELSAEHNKTVKKIDLKLEANTLKGHARYEYFGEAKTELHYAYHGTGKDRQEEALKDYISRRDKNRRVSNITSANFDDRKKPLRIEHDFEWDNQVLEAGEEQYISIDYQQAFTRGEMEEDRKSDYAFGYRFVDIFDITFQLPDEYAVIYLPENVDVSHPDFDIKVTFTQHPDRIEYRKELAIKNAIVRKADFPEWNKAIQALKAAYDDRIILKKK